MIGAGVDIFTPTRSVGGAPDWLPSGAQWYAEFDPNKRSYVNMSEYSSVAALLASSQATFSRSSSGLYLTDTGQYTPSSPGQIRTGDRGLLIEPERTNLVVRSHASDTLWINNGSTMTSAGLSNEMGQFTGARVASAGGIWNRAHGGTISFVSGTTYSAHFLYKAGTSGGVYINVFQSSSAVNIAYGGTIGSIARINSSGATSTPTHSETNLGGGVYLFEITFTLSVNATQGFGIGPYSTTSGEDIVVLGCQVEEGSSYSSLIETTGSTATRSADVFTLFPADGTFDITATFEDDTTQLISGQTITSSGWAVPTNLNQRFIKSLEASPS